MTEQKKIPRTTPEKWKKTLFSGVFFLTLSNILTKLCGLFLKVPLTNTLGDRGMAYFNLAYTVYKWFYMISTAGLPVAAAVITAEAVREREWGRVKKAGELSLFLFSLLGIAGSVCMAAGAPLFASLQGVPEAAKPILAVSPALFFICIASALRGWYQGLGDLIPASVSQVAEAAVKTVCGLLFGWYAMKKGYALPTVAAYAIAGLSVGCFAGMLVMLFPLRTKRMRLASVNKTDKAETKELLARLWKIALPVTVSASVLSLSDMLDSMIVIRRMTGAAGYTLSEALKQYGSYTALAVPMFNLPPILIYPITTALVPVIAGSDGEERKTLVRSSIRLSALISMPCSAGMTVMAYPILCLFFREDLAVTAAPLLSVLSSAVFFLSILAASSAILQAEGRAELPVYAMTAGAVVKLVTSWILVGNPRVGIMGTPVSTVLCYLVMAVTDLAFVFRTTGTKLPVFRTFWKPAAASLLCAGSAGGAYLLMSPHISPKAAALFSVLLAAVVYLAALVLFRAFDREILALLPKRNGK